MSDPLPDLPPAAARLVADVADEFRARQARGEDPDAEEYATRHPEAAGAIRRVLKVLRWAATVRPAQFRAVPAVLGADFRLGREVGRGAVGVVFEAEQVSLRRRVAVKVLQFAALADPRLLQRFEIEGRAAARLDHPHVVKVYEVGNDQGLPFIAMQFVDGRPLSELIPVVHGRDAADRGPTTTDPRSADFMCRVAALGAQAAEALEHAHASGVVHRDVKPGNLLIDASWNVWVTDFGLAKTAGTDVTGTGDVVGTLRYMSPEQALARHNLVDHRADVYGLGATLYELLTGRPAAPGPDKVEVLRQVTDVDPVPVRRLNPAVPRDLETVVHKCLRKDPGERYASARELADDLRRFLTGDPVRARPLGRAARLWRRAARRPALVGLAAAVVCASGLATGLGLFAAYRGARLEAERFSRERAEALAAAAAQREELQRFHAGLERVRQRRADPQMGWTRENLDDLSELAPLGPAGDFQVELRSEAASALGAIDLVQIGVLGPGRPAYGVDFSPDGRWIAVGDWKPDAADACHVRVYDARTRAPVDDLVIRTDAGLARQLLKQGTPTGVREVRFSPAPGRWLAAGTRDGRVVRWPADGLGTAPVPADPWVSTDHRGDPDRAELTQVGFLADGTGMVSATHYAVRLWAVDKSGAVSGLQVVPSHWLSDQSMAGPEILICYYHGTSGNRLPCHWLDVRTGGVRPAGVDAREVLGVGPPGRFAVCRGGRLDSVSVRAAFEGAEAAPVTAAAGARLTVRSGNDLQFSPTGGLFVSRLEHDHQFFVVDAVAARLAAQGTTTGDISAARFSPSGRQLALTSLHGTLLFNLTPGVLDSIGPVNERAVEAVAASPDHATVMAGANEAGVDPRFYLWHLDGAGAADLTKELTAGFQDWGLAGSAEFAPDGRRFFCTGLRRLAPAVFEEAITISDAGTRRAAGLRTSCWDPAGGLWMVCVDRLLRFDAAFRDTAVMWTNDPASEQAGVVVWSVAAGRRFVLMGRRDGTLIRVRPSNQEVASWKVAGAAIDALDVPPDDSRAVVGDQAGHVTLVDVGTGRATRLPTAHRAPVRSVSCGPGFFASGSADGTVRLWFDDGRPMATLRMGGPVRKVLLSKDGTSLLVHVDGERGVRRWHLDRLFAAWRTLGLGDGLPDF